MMLADKRDQDRGTGRTTRMVLQAVSHALEGFAAVVVMNTEAEIKDAMCLAIEHMPKGTPPFRTLNSNHRLSFKGQGYVQFIHRQTSDFQQGRLLGYPHNTKYLWDHHASDCAARDQRRAMRG